MLAACIWMVLALLPLWRRKYGLAAQQRAGTQERD